MSLNNEAQDAGASTQNEISNERNPALDLDNEAQNDENSLCSFELNLDISSEGISTIKDIYTLLNPTVFG